MIELPHQPNVDDILSTARELDSSDFEQLTTLHGAVVNQSWKTYWQLHAEPNRFSNQSPINLFKSQSAYRHDVPVLLLAEHWSNRNTQGNRVVYTFNTPVEFSTDIQSGFRSGAQDQNPDYRFLGVAQNSVWCGKQRRIPIVYPQLLAQLVEVLVSLERNR